MKNHKPNKKHKINDTSEIRSYLETENVVFEVELPAYFEDKCNAYEEVFSQFDISFEDTLIFGKLIFCKPGRVELRNLANFGK